MIADDETIRLKIRDWPPIYQGAVIAYARLGTIVKAAKEVGIARETLSRHINNGLDGHFTPEDWREVVSLLKYRESILAPQNLASWLQLTVLDKQDWRDLSDDAKLQLVEKAIDLSVKIADINSRSVAAQSRSRVTVETETMGGDIPDEVIDYATDMLRARFHQARYATETPDQSDTDDGDGDGGTTPSSPEEDQDQAVDGGSPPVRDGE